MADWRALPLWERALKGRQMGESQVVNRWRAQGEVRGRREALLELLRSKYPGSVSGEVVQLVEQQGDVALVRRWFALALSEGTFEGFVKALK